MARTSSPLPRRSKDPFVNFARELRDARKRAGNPTLKNMAEVGGVSEGSLSKAQNGDPRMSWRTASAWLGACEENPAQWIEKWTRLQRQVRCMQEPDGPQEGPRRRARDCWTKSGGLTAPGAIGTYAQLLATLGELQAFQRCSLREMAERSCMYSHSSLHAVLTGRRKLTLVHLKAILAGCGVSEADSHSWLAVLDRLDHHAVVAEKGK
ncbi:hypothetical protein ACWCPF_04010 [Streptomyces sp. NPDC001858]